MIRPLTRRLRQASKRNELAWRYTFNLGPTLAYRLRRRRLSVEAARVLEVLDRDGIAITTARALLGEDSCHDELVAAVDRLERDQADRLAAAGEAAKDPLTGEGNLFNIALLSPRPRPDPADVYVRFAIEDPVLEVANAYFGMDTKLSYYNVWHTFSTPVRARSTQLWHKDPEDRYILKVFLYLSDVDDGAGPFTYAAGSHPKARLRQEPSSSVDADGARRSDDEQMAEVVPPERWVKGVGPRGTLIFADTRGYHKGGLARERDRLLYTCQFLSHAANGGFRTDLLRRSSGRARPESTPPGPLDEGHADAGSQSLGDRLHV